MNLLRLSVAAAALSALAACTVNPRPVVVNTPPPVVAAPAPTVVTTPPTVTMGAPAAIEIPPGAYPGPGNCRIWIPGVALTQQQPAGSCSDLQNRVPAGGILLRG
jgi:mRNA-degrading endonuclease toxin of MazEF toxin-antitoxin module